MKNTKFVEVQGQLFVFKIDLSIDEMWFIIKNKISQKKIYKGNPGEKLIKNFEVLAKMWYNHRTLGCIYDPIMMERMNQCATLFDDPGI
jgi:hypothetical protein